jgi:hypothetical protein
MGEKTPLLPRSPSHDDQDRGFAAYLRFQFKDWGEENGFGAEDSRDLQTYADTVCQRFTQLVVERRAVHDELVVLLDSLEALVGFQLVGRQHVIALGMSKTLNDLIEQLADRVPTEAQEAAAVS